MVPVFKLLAAGLLQQRGYFFTHGFRTFHFAHEEVSRVGIERDFIYAGDYQNRNFRREGLDLARQLGPRLAGHQLIREDKINRLGRENLEGFSRRVGREHTITGLLQHQLSQEQRIRFIVYA